MMEMQSNNPKKLKKLRLERGLTIYSLSDMLGVNFSTISYWENGVKFPRPAKMMELEEIFGVSYRELFSDLTETEIEEMTKNKSKQSS